MKSAIAAAFLAGGVAMAAPPSQYGTTPGGKTVEQFVVANARGTTAKFISYGAILSEFHFRDRKKNLADVVLGFDDLASYCKDNPYFGCIAGRVANRIALGKFNLDGKNYSLATNNGPNHLHGGKVGFDKVVWKGEAIPNGVKFTYRSPDGEEGFPGNLDVAVTYTLTDDDHLEIRYEAITDKATPINLTQHSYFNLAGHASGDILGHSLELNADKYTAVDESLIPTGKLAPVDGTPFDFRRAKPIGSRIRQLTGKPQGYDLNYVVNGGGKSLAPVGELVDPKSGRMMSVMSTEPGVQLYTGNFLDGSLKGKGGAVYNQYQGVCLECQHFPDSINRPAFPSVVLRPGQKYTQTTIYMFSISIE